MKALCIDASNCPRVNGFTISEGEVYDILGEGEMFGVKCYLIHCTKTHDYYYATYRFIPLSEIDEKELSEKRFTDEPMW